MCCTCNGKVCICQPTFQKIDTRTEIDKLMDEKLKLEDRLESIKKKLRKLVNAR